MSIHGYNSNGSWQDRLSECLLERNLYSAPYKYGRKILRVLPHQINNDVEGFKKWYFETVNKTSYNLKISEPFHRPSIIAHSLGTWILVKTLTKYPEIKFDKIFLFGSIIPSEFDWFKLILRDQINSVVYEKADKDKIVPLGLLFTGSLKPCGTNGFVQKCSFIKEEVLSLFGHSDFDYKEHLFQYLDKRLLVTPHQLSAINGRDLTEKEITKVFKETLSIDRLVYAVDYQNFPIAINKAIEWFRIEKDIWSFVRNVFTKKILGYINALPVEDDVYNKFCKGEITESEIRPIDIVDYDNCENFNLLILSIAINKNIKTEETMLTKGRIVEMLIMSFMYKLEVYNAKSKLKKMAAFAWSDEGAKLCKGFCMTSSNADSAEHPLYEVDFKKLKRNSLNKANFMSKWWYDKHLRI